VRGNTNVNTFFHVTTLLSFSNVGLFSFPPPILKRLFSPFAYYTPTYSQCQSDIHGAIGIFSVDAIPLLQYLFDLLLQPFKLLLRIDLFGDVRNLVAHHVFDGILVHAIPFCSSDKVGATIMGSMLGI